MSSIVVVYVEKECEKGKEGKTTSLWPCIARSGVGQRVRFLNHHSSGSNGKLMRTGQRRTFSKHGCSHVSRGGV